MPSDYAKIRAENREKYGTDVGRYGQVLFASRYHERTHFIFELLQNAEDAFKKRDRWDGPRSVDFRLSDDELRISHFGKPFDEPDVRGICGILESTKPLTDIGRFGIGFKSVYEFTDCPEVHSGEEHFAIESFVWPKGIPPIQIEPDETVFRLPLHGEELSATVEITSGLKRLGARTLLFLREIEEVSWTVVDGTSGLYLRAKPEIISKHGRKVVVTGEDHATNGVAEETWLVFSREVATPDSVSVGYVEIAFRLEEGESSGELAVHAVSDSPLVVFFPTILQTNLGFLVQGPYRTTPSRDNVPADDTCNKHLVKETATLLVEALMELRGLGLLNVDTLRSLPLDAFRFREGTMFAPLFSVARKALTTQRLLPSFRGGHVTARRAKLARTQDLRELLGPSQLTSLFEADRTLSWLSEDITLDRAPEVRSYLMDELEIAEVIPETVVPLLTKPFLEAQTDAWIVRLYGFLHGQLALLRSGRLNYLPLVRLEDGSHVTARKDNQILAFLPGTVSTDFPIVRRSVCRTEDAVAFLRALGLTEPDPVDDVIANVIPQFQQDSVHIELAAYQADISRMLAAYSTDSNTQRTKLVTALRSAKFVAAVDAGAGGRNLFRPAAVYQATQRLKDLFQGVHGILIVDDSLDCLRGEGIRGLLEACGAALYLQHVDVEPSLTHEEKRELRSREESVGHTVDLPGSTDFKLRGLEELLAMMPQLGLEQASARAALLWEALCDAVARRGPSIFNGTYEWFYYRQREQTYDANFVNLLNEIAWVPDPAGTLQPPGVVAFEEIVPRWEPDPFLLRKIKFKPQVIAQLAKEVGIEPGVLDLLKQLGVTSVAELRERLGITDDISQDDGQQPPNDNVTPEEAILNLLGTQPEPTPPAPSPPESPVGPGVNGGSGGPQGGPGSRPNGGGTAGGQGEGQGGAGPAGEPGGSKGKSSKPPAGDRKFISYVAVDPNDGGPDPDGLDHQARMALEDQAIELVLSQEPELQHTPTNNPGFDLTKSGTDGQPVKWVEVKAMKGTFHDRPVGLSKTQFKCAQEHAEAYWLYIVECADSPEDARIFRIKDPAGKTQTFTFDHGWTAVAEITELPEAQRED